MCTRAAGCTARVGSRSTRGPKDGQTKTGLSLAAWRVERLGEIDRNKQDKGKPAPGEGDNPAPPATATVLRAGEDPIPF
jgi:hypothetical protein